MSAHSLICGKRYDLGVCTTEGITLILSVFQIAEEPERLELTGLSRWTFPWSHWRYYSVAHVCANRLAPLFLSAHGALPNSTSYPTRNEPTAAYNHNLPHTTIDAMSTPGDFDTTHPPPSDLDRPDPPMSSPLSDRVASYLPGG